MDLIGSYQAMGYTIEAYFPEQDAPDAWTLWVIRDGLVVGEFTTRMVVDSVYGMDHIAMRRLEMAAEIVAADVARRESASEVLAHTTGEGGFIASAELREGGARIVTHTEVQY